MLANLKTLAVVVAVAVLAVEAQTTTSSAAPSTSSLPAGLDSCILNCVTQAASSGGCSSYTDLQCVCTSTAFQSAALQCLQNNCPSSDVTAATQLQQQECAAFGGSSAGSSGAPTGTASGSASGTASTPSSTAPSSGSAPATSASASSTATPSTGAAAGLVAPFSLHGVLGTFVASAGALFGAAFVL